VSSRLRVSHEDSLRSSHGDSLRSQFEHELDACEYEILKGPAKLMRWAVPDDARDPDTGEVMHDDLLMSAALCSVLDEQPWSLLGGFVVQAPDPMKEIDEGAF
jgi:hypothetical protein